MDSFLLVYSLDSRLIHFFIFALHELCLHLYWKPGFNDDQGVFSNMAGIIEWTLHTENVFYCSGLNWLVSWKLRCWYQWRDIQAIATGNSQRLEVYGCKFIGSFVLQFIFFSAIIIFWYWVLTFLSIIFFFSILNLKGVKNLFFFLQWTT